MTLVAYVLMELGGQSHTPRPLYTPGKEYAVSIKQETGCSQGQESFLYSKTSRPALGPSQPPV